MQYQFGNQKRETLKQSYTATTLLNIPHEATGIRNDMQVILNTVERRNDFISLINQR
ncbi:hypothetical protein P4H71_04030 [Paenibacillus kribbensis]|uniref:hypothetical protein n=1 Tax=Paenibacillus kribbensis TaxID=172713 RepID=UPI002DBBCD9C|nr:hypothetical protein [Paenibacillus kribbensis]MEC0233523.1 hypothetical protein [Paenibacillus kribbensis]